jgi:hypothetical protein
VTGASTPFLVHLCARRPPLPFSPLLLPICGTYVSVTPVKMLCLHFSVYLSLSIIRCDVLLFATLVSLANKFGCHSVCLLQGLAPGGGVAPIGWNMGMDGCRPYPNSPDTRVSMDIHGFTLYVHLHNNISAKQQPLNTSIAVQRCFSKEVQQHFSKTKHFNNNSGGVNGRASVALSEESIGRAAV